MEKKFVDSAIANTNLSSSWAVYDPTNDSLAPIAEGDGQNDRDGRKAIVSQLFVHGQIHWDNTSGTANAYGSVRLVLVQDMQTNGAQLTATDVMAVPASGQAINSFRNLQYTTRFKILHDVYINPPNFEGEGNGTNATVTGRYVPFKMYVPSLEMPVTYNAAGAGIATTVDNSVHLLAIYGGDFAHPQIQYACRARFLG
jgi:hypothetical protein